jgi:nicotinamidase-related amidase
MHALAIIDMQRWMFRLPERAAQLPSLVPVINKLAADFEASGLPVFNVHVVHKADRSTWSRLMLKYDYPCMIEGTADVELVDGFELPPSARSVAKRANSAFLGTNFEEQLRSLEVRSLVLAGAFIDGCVGVTAADAEQRGFEVILAQDAMACCDAGRRDMMIEWLISMFELTTMNADTISKVTSVAGRDGSEFLAETL